MRNELQMLANCFFWERYIDTLSEANSEEIIKEFHKVLTTLIPSAKFKIICAKNPDLHQVIYQVSHITITI